MKKGLIALLVATTIGCGSSRDYAWSPSRHVKEIQKENLRHGTGEFLEERVHKGVSIVLDPGVEIKEETYQTICKAIDDFDQIKPGIFDVVRIQKESPVRVACFYATPHDRLISFNGDWIKHVEGSKQGQHNIQMVMYHEGGHAMYDKILQSLKTLDNTNQCYGMVSYDEFGLVENTATGDDRRMYVQDWKILKSHFPKLIQGYNEGNYLSEKTFGHSEDSPHELFASVNALVMGGYTQKAFQKNIGKELKTKGLSEAKEGRFKGPFYARQRLIQKYFSKK